MPLVEMTEEQIALRYLAENGLSAVEHDLANEMAKCDGGIGSHLMVYNPSLNRYVRKSDGAR